MMSVALDPSVRSDHSAHFVRADSTAVNPNNLPCSRETVDSPASDRPTAAGLQLVYTLSVLAVSGALLACVGWFFLHFLGSLATQLESLGTMQLLHALSGT